MGVRDIPDHATFREMLQTLQLRCLDKLEVSLFDLMWLGQH